MCNVAHYITGRALALSRLVRRVSASRCLQLGMLLLLLLLVFGHLWLLSGRLGDLFRGPLFFSFCCQTWDPWTIILIMAHVVFVNEDIRGRIWWFFFIFHLDLNSRAPPQALQVLRSFFLLDHWRSGLQCLGCPLVHLDRCLLFFAGLTVKSRVTQRSGHAHHCGGVESQTA